MAFHIVFPMIWAFSIILCGYYGESKQPNIKFWIAMGIAFGPLALPFLIFAKPRK